MANTQELGVTGNPFILEACDNWKAGETK